VVLGVLVQKQIQSAGWGIATPYMNAPDSNVNDAFGVASCAETQKATEAPDLPRFVASIPTSRF
jgi:hypothetical protein